MKRLYFVLFVAVFFVAASAKAQTLIHYWNFNTTSTLNELLTPTTSIVGTPSITNTGGTIQNTSNTGQSFADVNARSGDAALSHLRFDSPLGNSLTFSLPTTGYQDAVVKYSTRRSGQGAGTQKIEYTVNGTDYISFSTVTVVDGTPELVTLDFSSIATTDDNSNFKIKIIFEQGGGGTGGNNRLDNFTVDAFVLGSDVTAPNATFSPATAAVSVSETVAPTITFNEDIRLVNDGAIDNTNVDNLVELKLDNASGGNIPFDATISGKVITITPTSALPYKQLFYVALKANVVEDLSNNAVVNVQSATFTTTTQQTQFQAGDIVIVAYRTNASTPDEIKFVTFVDILPETRINFTDAKFTDNAQPQCPGGFTWTSPTTTLPAGSTVSIVVDANPPTTNKGTTSGSGFGLSSGGDQVIVYTGTAASPNYITALSSNGWVNANTSCGGSASKIPAGLIDGQTALNTSTSPGASGNAVNAFYNGTQSGNAANLRASILNPANWTTAGSGTTAQVWPAWGPEVSSASVVNQTTIKVVFNSAMDVNSVNTLLNYSGIAGLTTAGLDQDGKTITLTFANAFTAAASYSLVINNLKDAQGRVMDSYTFSFTYSTKISFDKKFISVAEDAGNASIKIKIENPSAASVNLVVKAAPFSTASANDFTYTSSTVTITGTANEQTISIPVINDTAREQDEYFVLSLETPTGASITGGQYMTVYIKDNDEVAPAATKAISLSHVTSFDPVPGTSTAEIVMHDPQSKRIFIISSIQSRLDIADFSNPAAITLIKSVDMTPYGGITSVAVRNGIVAAASPNITDDMDNGSVVFFDTDGNHKKTVTVGVLPDMVTFAHDGSKVLTANEGQPNDAYTVDPEGSVSIIDVSGGIDNLDQSKVTTLLFTAFNSQEAALIEAGVRKLKKTSTLSKDFEPEYITISTDNKKAWVTLQENNAIAEINLETKGITSVWPLGKKDHSVAGNGLDASDNSGIISIANWPVKSFYIPDAIAGYQVGDVQYLVTANEGDEKEYSGLTERTTVGAVTLDPTVFPQGDVLKENHNIGRLRMTNLSGDTDGDGDYDEINIPGGRSFTIWNAGTKQKVYDSGDELERITSIHPASAAIFNADNESNAFKSRSRAKGPEPEGLTVAKLDDKVYAFIALERVGGVMIYDITDPAAPKFTDYANSRSTTAYQGDQGPEGIIYISRQNSPNGKAYILVANEISGTISVFEVLNVPKVDQTITFTAIADKKVGDAAFALTATSSASLPVTFATSDDEITLSGSQVTIVKAGKVSIKATQAGTEAYKVAEAIQSFCINPAKPTITLSGANTATPTLQSSATAGNQWYKDGAIISGATNATYTVNAAGVYTVKSTIETCASEMSAGQTMIITGDISNTFSQLNVSPNPADDAVLIQLPGVGRKSISIMNASGSIVTSQDSDNDQEVIRISDWAKGFYIVHVKAANGNYFGKFIRK